MVAWRTLHLPMLGCRDPQAVCTVFFEDPE
jgi:hypothetical protein